MSERYGNIPEKFTKAWFGYYWEYYKWYAIVPLVIIIAITATVVTKINEPKYDTTLTYAANNMIFEEDEAELVSILSELCDDVDENGEKSLFFSQLWISNNPDQEDIEYARMTAMKLQLAFAEDEKYIYILDKEAAELFVGETEADCPYAPIEEWATKIPENADILSAHGANYGICLSGNKILEGHGMDLSDHYLIMRYPPRKDQEKRQRKGYESAIALANRIIAEN